MLSATELMLENGAVELPKNIAPELSCFSQVYNVVLGSIHGLLRVGCGLRVGHSWSNSR